MSNVRERIESLTTVLLFVLLPAVLHAEQIDSFDGVFGIPISKIVASKDSVRHSDSSVYRVLLKYPALGDEAWSTFRGRLQRAAEGVLRTDGFSETRGYSMALDDDATCVVVVAVRPGPVAEMKVRAKRIHLIATRTQGDGCFLSYEVREQW